MRSHGTISNYNAGCRCAKCTRAARDHRRKYPRVLGHHQMCPWCCEWFARAGIHERFCDARAAS